MIKKLINYLKESKEELTKVVWPTRNKTIEIAIFVIVISLLIGAYLGGLDYLLNQLMLFIIN